MRSFSESGETLFTNPVKRTDLRHDVAAEVEPLRSTLTFKVDNIAKIFNRMQGNKGFDVLISMHEIPGRST